MVFLLYVNKKEPTLTLILQKMVVPTGIEPVTLGL